MTPPNAAEREIAEAKRRAAAEAVTAIESGMVVGLGAGSTAALATEQIAERVKEGQLRDLVCVPCSRAVGRHARSLGLTVVTLADQPKIDITIDGADEVDPTLNLIKGAGGALLYEKMVAQASAREIIIVDERKLSPRLGTQVRLPIEVFPFGWRAEELFVQTLGAEPEVRTERGQPLVTDEGNMILDCRFPPIADVIALARLLDARAGIAGHGLFVHLAVEVIVGSASSVRRLTRAA